MNSSHHEDGRESISSVLPNATCSEIQKDCKLMVSYFVLKLRYLFFVMLCFYHHLYITFKAKQNNYINWSIRDFYSLSSSHTWVSPNSYINIYIFILHIILFFYITYIICNLYIYIILHILIYYTFTPINLVAVSFLTHPDSYIFCVCVW